MGDRGDGIPPEVEIPGLDTQKERDARTARVIGRVFEKATEVPSRAGSRSGRLWSIWGLGAITDFKRSVGSSASLVLLASLMVFVVSIVYAIGVWTVGILIWLGLGAFLYRFRSKIHFSRIALIFMSSSELRKRGVVGVPEQKSDKQAGS